MIEMMDTCPLCGSQIVFTRVSKSTGSAFDGYIVHCSNPQCSGHSMATGCDSYINPLFWRRIRGHEPQRGELPYGNWTELPDWTDTNVEALRGYTITERLRKAIHG